MAKSVTGKYETRVRVPSHVQARVEDDRTFWFEQVESLIEGMNEKGIPVRLVRKDKDFRPDKGWERLLFWLGRMLIPKFDQATQAMGPRIYLSSGLLYHRRARLSTKNTYRVVLHECTHVLQWYRFRKLVLGWHFGAYLIWGLLYLLLTPILFTVRSLWEREAYVDGHAALVRTGLNRDTDKYCDWVVQLFTSNRYVWMDPIWGGGFKEGGKARQALERGHVTDVERFTGRVLPLHPEVDRYLRLVE